MNWQFNCGLRRKSMESSVQRMPRVVNTNGAKDNSQQDYGDIKRSRRSRHGVPSQAQVEITWPDKGEHSSGEAANQTHEQGEMRDTDRHGTGKKHQA
ncbi:hypothetical protein PoB_002957100 [Plakobranchus ocellatus]|uniref:Uncharacterized protein n=1 Tax=Plakobranchus ocellatus TaxID=259542 RepID=A0AAV4A4C0_9GAST|nr:hypothetical protein PoB_002957100 [Plakobranchus ocellatus]